MEVTIIGGDQEEPAVPRGTPDGLVHAGAGIPDLRWINRHLAIEEVARKLNLRFGEQRKLHCWRPERHQHGDRTPSVSIWRKQNKLKCFGRNTRPIGPVDLVMNVLQVDLPNAVLWIATEFDVPRIRSGKHLKTPERRIFQVGCESPSELLVRSGVWGKLRPQTQRLVPVLLSFAEQGSDECLKLQISYRALMRYSGIRFFNSVSASLRELVEIGWMQAPSQTRLPPVAREAAVYILTPFGAAFSEFANCTAAELREEIEREREFRKAEKQRRLRGARQR